MQENRVSVKDIVKAMKQLPQTIRILLKIDKKSLFEIIILSILTGIFPLITLILSQELINSIVRMDKVLRCTILLFVIYMVVSFFGDIITEIKSYIQNKFQFLLQYKLNYFVMDKCCRLSLTDFESSEMYDKVEKITGEIMYKPYQMFLSIIELVTALITMSSSAVFLFVWNPYVSMLLLVVPIISVLYYLKIGQQEFEIMWNRAKDERKTWYLGYILTHDFSFKEISVLNLKEYILNKYWNISKKFIGQNFKILNKKTLFNIIYEFIMQCISFVIIGIAIISAYAGKILVGNVMSYIKSVSLVQSNSLSIMANIYNIYNTSLYMQMLFEFLDYSETKQDNNRTYKIEESITSIQFKGVSFSYSNGIKALNNIDLLLNKGEKIALVGPNGSGKSTLLKILVGLYDIEDGDILINGQSIKKIDLQDYYSKISVLFQDFVKYEFTLKENIGFGDINNLNCENKIFEILKRLDTDFLKDNNGNYDLNMQLGTWFDDGRQLSQGQWQKIALGRAYYKDASLYILDEPNAALDTISEKRVFQSFFDMSDNKIGIFISHRLNATKMADKIIVMDRGNIVAVGKHDDLIKDCEVYQKLYEAEIYGNEEMLI